MHVWHRLGSRCRTDWRMRSCHSLQEFGPGIRSGCIIEIPSRTCLIYELPLLLLKKGKRAECHSRRCSGTGQESMSMWTPRMLRTSQHRHCSLREMESLEMYQCNGRPLLQQFLSGRRTLAWPDWRARTSRRQGVKAGRGTSVAHACTCVSFGYHVHVLDI